MSADRRNLDNFLISNDNSPIGEQAQEFVQFFIREKYMFQVILFWVLCNISFNS
jgi:hypothetical protein